VPLLTNGQGELHVWGERLAAHIFGQHSKKLIGLVASPMKPIVVAQYDHLFN
jgi:hypothetical protein